MIIKAKLLKNIDHLDDWLKSYELVLNLKKDKIVSRDGSPTQKITPVVSANKARACKLVGMRLDKET